MTGFGISDTWTEWGISEPEGRELVRVCRKYGSPRVFDVGTGNGASSAHLAKAELDVVTFEKLPQYRVNAPPSAMCVPGVSPGLLSAHVKSPTVVFWDEDEKNPEWLPLWVRMTSEVVCVIVHDVFRFYEARMLFARLGGGWIYGSTRGMGVVDRAGRFP